MNYFTDENDLNKFNNLSPDNPDNKKDQNTAGVLDIFVASIIRINKLAVLCVENAKKFIGYVIFMSILVSFMAFLVPSASRIFSFGGFSKLFREDFPTFSIEDGVLTADKKFEMKLNNAFLVINTDIDEFSIDDFDSSGVYMAFGKRNVKLVTYVDDESNKSYNEVYSYPIGMVLPSGLNNEVMANMTPLFYFTYIIIFFGYAIFAGVKYVFFALLYAFFTRTTTSISKLNLSMKDSVHLCFYAETISIILVNINEAVGYFIPSIFMTLASIIITVAVIMNAVKPHMPDIDEFMNRFGGNNKDN